MITELKPFKTDEVFIFLEKKIKRTLILVNRQPDKSSISILESGTILYGAPHSTHNEPFTHQTKTKTY